MITSRKLTVDEKGTFSLKQTSSYSGKSVMGQTALGRLCLHSVKTVFFFTIARGLFVCLVKVLG
jgi:hypothetical protein